MFLSSLHGKYVTGNLVGRKRLTNWPFTDIMSKKLTITTPQDIFKRT